MPRLVVIQLTGRPGSDDDPDEIRRADILISEDGEVVKDRANPNSVPREPTAAERAAARRV